MFTINEHDTIEGLHQVQFDRLSSEPEIKRSQKVINRIKQKTMEKIRLKKQKEAEENAKLQRELMLDNEKKRLKELRSYAESQINKNKSEFDLVKKSEIHCPKCFSDIASYSMLDNGLKANFKPSLLVNMYYNKKGDLICGVCGFKIEKELQI